MRRRQRDVLEQAVHVLAEQATAASALVDEAMAVGLGGSHSLTLHTKMLRLELLGAKAALERELGTLVLHCSDCGRDVHWIAGLVTAPGHWAHAEPAPHHDPSV